MFKNVPKKNWSEDPFLTVIGTMTNIDFMRHLVKSVILQSNLTVYGRFDLFLLTYQSLYNVRDFLNFPYVNNKKINFFRLLKEKKVIHKCLGIICLKCCLKLSI